MRKRQTNCLRVLDGVAYLDLCDCLEVTRTLSHTSVDPVDAEQTPALRFEPSIARSGSAAAGR